MFEGDLRKLSEGGEYLLYLDTELYGAKTVVAGIHMRRCEFRNVGLRGLCVTGFEIRQTRFFDCYMPDVKFSRIDFTGCKFIGCDLRHADFENCILEYVSFERCLLNYESILKNLPEARNNLKWKLLKNLRLNAASEGDAQRANTLYLLELATSRRHQWDEFLAKGHFKENTALDRLAALTEWLLHNLNRFLWGYGLKPSRLFITAGFLVLLFAQIYVGFHVDFKANLENGIRPLGYAEAIYVSAVNFSTLRTSDFSPIGWGGRSAEAVQGILGAVFIGLLAATFFRRWAR